MGKRLSAVSIVALSACILTARPVAAESGLDFAGGLFRRSLLRSLLPALRGNFGRFRGALFFNPQADGGGSGDGGSGGDGSSGSDGSSGDGTGDAGPGSSSADGVGASDNTGASDETGPSDNSDPDADPTDPTALTDPTNQNAVNTLDNFAVQQAHDAVTTPWGGVPERLASGSVDETGANPVPGSPEPGIPGGPGATPGSPGAPGRPNSPPGGTGPLPPTAPGQDVAINAVIVSGAESPWDAISKVPGVRNVTVTGGVIALGGTPELTGTGTFFQVFPDRRLLNGSVIPPVVPNVIDIRIMNCPIEVADDSPNPP
jgi:hypothetical protein